MQIWKLKLRRAQRWHSGEKWWTIHVSKNRHYTWQILCVHHKSRCQILHWGISIINIQRVHLNETYSVWFLMWLKLNKFGNILMTYWMDSFNKSPPSLSSVTVRNSTNLVMSLQVLRWADGLLWFCTFIILQMSHCWKNGVIERIKL